MRLVLALLSLVDKKMTIKFWRGINSQSLFQIWAFLLPIYSYKWNGSELVILLTVATVLKAFEQFQSYGVVKFESNYCSLSLLTFYFISVLGVFYTLHPFKGIDLLETQFPFFLIVIFYSLKPLSLLLIKRILLIVIVSTLILALFLILKSVSIAYENGDVTQLFYVNFSPISRFYPTFNTLYSSFAFIVLFSSFRYKESLFKKTNLLILIGVLILGLFTFLIDSKAGSLVFFLELLFFATWYVVLSFQKRKLILLVGILGIIFFLFNSSPRNLMMVESIQVNKNNATSTSQRLTFIKAGVETLLRTLPFGEGSYEKTSTPEFSISLDKYLQGYPSHSEFPMAMKRSHAHNQYIDSALRHGVLGIVALSVLLFSLLYVPYKKRDLLLILMVMIVAFYFCVEGILLTSYGVNFFCLFWIVAVTIISKDKKSNKVLSISENLISLSKSLSKKTAYWPLGIVLILTIVAHLLLLLLSWSELTINYGIFMGLPQETVYTYVPWCILSTVVLLARCVYAKITNEQNNKWVVYVMIVFVQPGLLLFFL